MVMVVLGVVLLVEVVMVVIVLWRIIMRNILQYRVRLGQLNGESHREGGRGPPYGGSARIERSSQNSGADEAAVQVEVSGAANVGRGGIVLTLIGRTLQPEEQFSQRG